MEPNAFIGKTTQPTDADLAAALGSANKTWNDLLQRLAGECNLADQEWNSYSPKAGWSLRLKAKKRNIVYLAPHAASCSASFVLGAKAIAAAHAAKLPAKVLKLIDEGPRYPEGTAVRFLSVAPRDIAAIVKLAMIKIGN